MIPESYPISNSVVGSPNLSSGQVEYASYGYNIHTGPAAFFVAAFALSGFLHMFQAIRSRRWTLLGTIILGTLLESFGWGARLWSAQTVEWAATYGGYWNSSDSAFLAQICVLIFSPAFIIAACYVTLGSIIRRVGFEYSYLHPTTYTALFVFGDFVSLVVQAIGGGMAASSDTLEGANSGAKVMVGGVIFQMIIMVAFTLLLASFAVNYLRRRPVKQFAPFAFAVRPFRARRNARRDTSIAHESSPDAISELTAQQEKKVELQLLGLALSTLFIFVRSVYRTIELLDGWHGKIIENQTLFDVLDGAMILASVVCFNVFHPVFLLGPASQPGSSPNEKPPGSPDLIMSKLRPASFASSTPRVDT